MERVSLLNIHIYPSSMTHESRLFRETAVIEQMNGFSEIEIVGVRATGLPNQEQISPTRRIVRLGPQKWDGQAKAISYALWMLNAIWYCCFVRRPQFINCHSLTTLPIGVLAKLFAGSTVIYDAHELETETNGLQGFRQALSRWLERALIRFCDHSIFVSKSIQEWYVNAYRLTDTSVIYNVPAVASAIGKGTALRDQLDIPAEKKIFLYLGALAPGRGILSILEAFKRMPEFSVVFMGTGSLENQIKDAAKSLPNVHYVSPVLPADVVETASSADFGISMIEPTSLSYKFAMPNKLFEYLAAGLPVLASPIPEQEALVREHGVGVVTAGLSADDIYVAAQDIATQGDILRGGISSALAAYSWKNQSMDIQLIYNRFNVRSFPGYMRQGLGPK